VNRRSGFLGLCKCYLVALWRTDCRAWNHVWILLSTRSGFWGLYECNLVAQWRIDCRTWNRVLIPVSTWKRMFLWAVWLLSRRSEKNRLQGVELRFDSCQYNEGAYSCGCMNVISSLSEEPTAGGEFMSWILSVQGRSCLLLLYICYHFALWRTLCRAWNHVLIPAVQRGIVFLGVYEWYLVSQWRNDCRTWNHILIVSTRIKRFLGAVWMLSK
jgi:hypothetical protein